MSNELKIGLLAAIGIALTIWGLQFMKGKNILNASNKYYVKYADVDQLTASASVLIRGLKVGTVSSVALDDDMQSVIATLDLDKSIRIPKNTEALVINLSLMGGKGIDLKFGEPCSGADCASNGDFLNGRVEGMLESMIDPDQMDEMIDKVKTGIGSIARAVGDSLTSEDADSQIAASVKDLTTILSNLASITSTLERSMNNYDRKLIGIFNNLQSITSELSKSSPQIGIALGNMTEITQDLKEAKLGESLAKTGDLIDQATSTMTSLDGAVASANTAFNNLGKLMEELQNGKGTMGKLLKDEAMYDQILIMTRNLELFLQDFRLNPKRYIEVSIFHKKQKEYVVPENDPAFKN